MKSAASSGIYVEILIRQDLARIWELTQKPDLHQQWDLRFSRIQYLPRPCPAEPQRFLYETRIGFGLSVKGTGESTGERTLDTGASTSSLKFASDDPKSPIQQGSGYWRYVPLENGVRFYTWYDYQVRFGSVGRLVDRLAFRPLIGWATAWSFDRLRLWAELDQSPKLSLRLAVIHAVVRFTLAFIWIWHGLIPKLLYSHVDERTMLARSHLPIQWLPWIGALEIAFGILILCTWNKQTVLVANGLLMLAATVAVAISSPAYLKAAFDPVTLNLGVVALCIVGWIASGLSPSASRCLRTAPKGES